jgi:metal-responsive CopG/Arc/MetJ family transcriptional regulator
MSDDESNELKDQRVPIMMSARELKAIDDWRRNREELPSRSEAIRQLIELGLANGLHLKLSRRRPKKSA